MLEVTNSFTVEDMRRFAGEAWGQFGCRVVDKWCEYNATYFANELRPIPLMITQTQPYGHLIGKCSGAGNLARVIQLNVPRDEYVGRQYPLLADNGTLLHEMVHQLLHERSEDAAHMSSGWRREIMRLNKQITGREIWAGPSVVRRINGKSTRLNAPDADGRESLTQAVIARWPHDKVGIDLGTLGEVQRIAACSS
jgi:hypothetical protein